MDSPAFRADLARAEAECKAFAEAYRGKLAALARGEDAHATLGEAVQRYEALEDLIGRLMSYAGLVYAGDTTDPARAKFYGDTQERLTDGLERPAVLRARAQPHRRRACSNRRWRPTPLAHYRPWLEDIRKDKPYQLDDKLEQLFHEKSVTGRARLEPAVRRDDGGAALRRRRRGADARADAQPAAGPGREARRKAPPRRSPRRFKAQSAHSSR